MREYSKISPRFWTGGTGKSIRGDLEAQVLALYLMTCPHANMIGVFYCPRSFMAHETGLTIVGASKALARLIEADFCTFDDDDEVVWVHAMAEHQIGRSMSANDKQVVGIRKQFESIRQTRIRRAFAERYGQAFHLHFDDESASPSEDPKKPLLSQEQEQEHEQDRKLSPPALSHSTEKPAECDQLACPVEKIVSLYHELMPDNPRCKVISDKRRKTMRQRWREASRLDAKPFGYSTQADGLAAWRAYFEVCAESEFLTGKAQPGQGRPPFVADLDFLMSPSGFVKTLENKYHR